MRLLALCASKPAVADMVVEVCVCELEEAAAGGGRAPPQPVTVDSPHPYADDTDISGMTVYFEFARIELLTVRISTSRTPYSIYLQVD